MRTTLNDVAKKAGVSPALVSLYLNQHPRSRWIAAATKERIAAVVRELNYQPSAAARALSMGRTSLLGLVVGEIANPYYSHFVENVLDEASRSNYRVMIVVDKGDASANLNDILGQQVAGVIYCPPYRQAGGKSPAKPAPCPLLLVDQHIEGCSAIVNDVEEAMYRAVLALKERGHAEIAGLFGKAQTKSDAFRKGCKRAGVKAAMLDWPNSCREERAATAKRLCELRPPALAANGHLTIGALVREIRTAHPGYRPDLVMSCGYWSGSARNEFLTGVVLNHSEALARQAVKSLLRAIEKSDEAPGSVTGIAAEFIPAARLNEIPVSDPEDEL